MTITPEVEVLDHLLAGPSTLPALRNIFDDDDSFRKSLLAMLYAGDIRLLGDQATEVRSWEWQTVVSDPSEWSNHRIAITTQGAKHL